LSNPNPCLCITPSADAMRSWMRTLLDGGLSKESKALLVHAGLAALYRMFWRRYGTLSPLAACV
jgi:hypothetical protein